MSLILSLHSGIHDSAAALFDDYQVIGAVQKERLTRTKKAGGPPLESRDELLDMAGVTIEDVECVVFSRAEVPMHLYRPGIEKLFGDEKRKRKRKRKTRTTQHIVRR